MQKYFIIWSDMRVPDADLMEIIGNKKIESPISAEGMHVVRNELALPHAAGRFRMVKPTPENLSVSVYEPSERLPSEALDSLAVGIEGEKYLEVADAMLEGRQGELLYTIAEGLEENKKYVVNMNHPSLIRAGEGFSALCRSLERLGADFETAAVVGIMLTQLEVSLLSQKPGEDKPLPDESFMKALAATGFISNHSIITVPNTERVKNSGLMNFEDEVKDHRSLGKDVLSLLTGEERQKGLLALIITGGTHDLYIAPEKTKDGQARLIIRRVGRGSIKLIMENGLEVIQMEVPDIPGQPFDARISEGPELLTRPNQMRQKMIRTAVSIGDKVPDVSVEYEDQA